MKDAKHIDIHDKGHPRTKPYINISLISPPPIDSFLKILSPNIFIKYIIENIIIPSNMFSPTFNPFLIDNSIINNRPQNANNSSGIVIV